MDTKQKQRYLKLKYSNVRKEVLSMVWIRRNDVYALLGEIQETQV